MQKLQRQRALLHEHLRWLESEIAAEASALTAPPPAAEPEPAPAAVERAADAPAHITTAAESEIPEPNVRGIHSEVRSGCLLYFALACAGFGLVVAFIYWRY